MYIDSIQNTIQIVYGIINNVQKIIEQKQLLVHLPIFCHNQISNILATCIKQFQQQNVFIGQQIIKIQIQDSVKKIPKDNLICFNMQKEKISMNETHYIQITQVYEGKVEQKGLNQPKSPRRYLSRQITKSKLQKQSASKLLLRKKVTQNPLVNLQHIQKISHQQQIYRKIKNLQYEQELKNNQQKKNSINDQQKKKDKIISQQSNFIFDVDGSILKSNKVNINKLNPTLKKIAINLQNIQKISKQKIKQEPSIINSKLQKKNSKNIIEVNQSLTIQLANTIPILSALQKQQKLVLAGPSLNIYKKKYGGRYSSIAQSFIDEKKKTKEQNDRKQQQQIQFDFSRPQSLNKSIKSDLKRSGRSHYTKHYDPQINKLVLPKLNGRYNMLDKFKTFKTHNQIEIGTIQ